MIDRNRWSAHLEKSEGRRNKPYRDNADPPRLTIGVGRNLDEVGLSDEEIDFLRDNDMDKAESECLALPYWLMLDDIRQLVIGDMVFNLGMPRFRKFVKLNAALAEGDYTRAAAEMRDSKWYGQVGTRAIKLAAAMESGAWR